MNYTNFKEAVEIDKKREKLKELCKILNTSEWIYISSTGGEVFQSNDEDLHMMLDKYAHTKIDELVERFESL